MAITNKCIALGIFVPSLLAICLSFGVVIGLLLRKKQPGNGPGGAISGDFPVVPYLGFRGTYLIALADPTTEAKFLPNVASFVPTKDDLCEPGKQCTGGLRYDGSQKKPDEVPHVPDLYPDEPSYIIIITLSVLLFFIIVFSIWYIIKLYKDKKNLKMI